jgi:hypothetical protein
MEQETAQGSVEVEKPVKKSPEPFTIIQTHLNKITEAIKENTVALVEMGIIIQRLENTLKERNHG